MNAETRSAVVSLLLTPFAIACRESKKKKFLNSKIPFFSLCLALGNQFLTVNGPDPIHLHPKINKQTKKNPTFTLFGGGGGFLIQRSKIKRDQINKQRKNKKNQLFMSCSHVGP